MRLTGVLRRFAGLLVPLLALGQIPRVGVVDFYGLRKLPEERARAVVRVAEGDRLPASKAVIEERLEELPEVVLARLEAVCCAGERAILYVGIEERGAPHFDFREPPSGLALLPEDVVETYREFLRRFADAARAGHSAEDLSQGHPLAADPAVRSLQEQFTAVAAERLDLLRQVVRDSSNGEHRAIAAAILGYAPRKTVVVPDLQYAMKDPEESVRANAMRALGAMAELPDLRVESTWFVEMLNSIVWSDRYRASQALVNLTAARPAGVLAHLRESALAALVEMARWKTPTHARPAFTILGRVAGMADGEIDAAWEKDRASLFKRFAEK